VLRELIEFEELLWGAEIQSRSSFKLHPAKRVSEARKKALDVMTNEVVPACHKNGVQGEFMINSTLPSQLVVVM
jgi:hypothetical protein